MKKNVLISLGVLILSIDIFTNFFGDVWHFKAWFTLRQAWTFMHTDLSRQFDIGMAFKLYVDTISSFYTGSAFVRLQIKDKLTDEVIDRIFLRPVYLYSYYEDKNAVMSYTTGFNADWEVADNFFGYLVVADLNFDGKDDISVICEGGGNGGPLYAFYIQTDDRKFVMNNYLTTNMQYFPTEIDSLRRQLTTYAHASAYSLYKCIYQQDSITDK